MFRLRANASAADLPWSIRPDLDRRRIPCVHYADLLIATTSSDISLPA